MSWAQFEPYKFLLYLVAPLAWFAVTRYMDELLPPRMLGGLVLLLAAPVLDAARWNPSPLRLIVVTLVYGMIIWGMIVLLSPFRYRHTVERIAGSFSRAKVTGWTLLAGAAFHIGAGLFVF